MMADVVLKFLFLLLLIFSVVYRCESQLNRNGRNVVSVEVSYSSSYTTTCGFLNWSRCKRYRTSYQIAYRCAAGWSSNGGTECVHAICGGKTTPTGACDQTAFISTRYGHQWKSSSGSCVSPENCDGCSPYFYNNGPVCTACPSITNCVEMHCDDSADSTICARCEGVVREQKFYRAYIRSSTNKQCLKTCSWRKDSTRCFPGNCGGELASNCVCAPGFTGTHCEKMTEQASILSNWFNLRDKNDVLNNPSNTVDPGTHPIVWSNYGGWNLAETAWSAKYVMQSIPNSDTTHFVKTFVYGIIEASTSLRFSQTFKKDIVVKHGCPEASLSNPATSSFDCKHNFSINSGSAPFSFNTGDTMTFTIEAKIGGYLIVDDREKNVDETHHLIGTTKTLQYVFRWDFVPPYHCSERNANPRDCVDPLTVPDLTENV